MLALVAFELCSCNRAFLLDSITSGEDTRVNEVSEQIVTALENGDTSLIKTLFSKKSIENNNNLEDEIVGFLSFIEGDIVSWEDYLSASWEHTYYGEKTVYLEYIISISTDTNKYDVVIQDYWKNDSNPKNAGIHAMLVCFSGDESVQTDTVFYGLKDENDTYLSSYPGIIFLDSQNHE